MSLCLATPVLALALAADSFTLRWTHSVELSGWQEDWRVEGHTLVLAEARVRGSGAGMEPPEGAVWREGWWVYTAPRRLPVLRLAVSGATAGRGGGWQLCTADAGCRDLERLLQRDGVAPSAIELRAGACGEGTPQLRRDAPPK